MLCLTAANDDTSEQRWSQNDKSSDGLMVPRLHLGGEEGEPAGGADGHGAPHGEDVAPGAHGYRP